MEKVGQIALNIHPHSFSDRIAMDSFQGTLTPPQFKHQLERSFAIQLTGKEAGALMNHFDTDASGTIEGSEVLDMHSIPLPLLLLFFTLLLCLFPLPLSVVHQSLYEN